MAINITKLHVMPFLNFNDIYTKQRLQHRLSELHFHKEQHVLTPLQHEAFIYFLGDSGE